MVLNATPAQIYILRAADHIPGFLIGRYAGREMAERWGKTG